VRSLPTGARALLNATATGVLLFLFWDVLVHAVEPVESALVAVTRDGTGTWTGFISLAAVFVAALVFGLMTLVYYEQWMGRAKATARPFGPGAASVAEFTEHRTLSTASPARRLALLIAVGIGLHNFSEGLAIGQSAAAGQLSLAIPLIVGFGLHNATEGFGIVAPLAGEPTRPTWGFLALLGLIAGGPTLIGTLLGQSFVNETVSVAFLALAAGSILYVVVQLLRVAQNLGHRTLMFWGLLLGLILGFGTDFVIVAAGA
jgi:ZIP family zinc transporter